MFNNIIVIESLFGCLQWLAQDYITNNQYLYYPIQALSLINIISIFRPPALPKPVPRHRHHQIHEENGQRRPTLVLHRVAHTLVLKRRKDCVTFVLKNWRLSFIVIQTLEGAGFAALRRSVEFEMNDIDLMSKCSTRKINHQCVVINHGVVIRTTGSMWQTEKTVLYWFEYKRFKKYTIISLSYSSVML